MTSRSTQRLVVRRIRGTHSSFRCSLYMSLRADRFRQKAAEAKQSAAKAQNPSMKKEFEEVAAAWLVLAEQMEWIDREHERKTAPGGRP